MPSALTSQPTPQHTLERAILQALAYSDIFDFPLRLEELHLYLPIRAELKSLPTALKTLNKQIGTKEGFYFLASRETIVETRQERAERSRRLLPDAIRYGRLLGLLPFVRMVALTGSLAAMNLSTHADFDYMLITSKGRVWTARAFALLLNRFTRRFGHILCPNLIVSETALEWQQRDLYSAHEFCQMIPITGITVFRKLIKANAWIENFLPNAFPILASRTTPSSFHASQCSVIQTLLELPLRGKLGDRFEYWEMTRKIARLSKQQGFGEETTFNAQICQGNFHHHRKRTHEIYRQKLKQLDDNFPLLLRDNLE
jgi:hypothetical protein